MRPTRFYEDRISTLKKDLSKLRKRKSALGWMRFGSIAAIVVVFYVLWSLGAGYVIASTIILMIVFAKLLFADLANKESIEHLDRLMNINDDELKALSGDYYKFPEGTEFILPEHCYSNDLDIFGRASLFQYINRGGSQMGQYILAEYLKAPALEKIILERQQAATELSAQTLWRQDLQALGRKTQITFSTQERLASWIKEPPVFLKFKPWRWLRYLLPLVICGVVVLYIFDEVSSAVFYGGLLFFAVIAYQVNKVIAPIHEKLSRIAEELDVMEESIEHIEQQKFQSDLLVKFQRNFLHNEKKVSLEIRKIKKLLDKLDLRYNLLLSAPLNILFLWNLQQLLDLERWKENHQDDIDKWFQSLGHFEALSSFSTLSFNQPTWTFPSIVSGYFLIEGKEIGHPLLRAEKRVNNNISIKHDGELMLVTGSNMAGKSTYLRSIGINVVLAMAGAPVCAIEFNVSHVQIISSMRITDSLEESTSTFYAELKKLKTIIEKVNGNEKIFILLDEILRGTNSLDRHTGSVALMKQLIKSRAAAIIATHDLELAKLKNEYPDNISNYHFDVQVTNDELYFDYKLKPGVCNSLNASILMKKIGIEL